MEKALADEMYFRRFRYGSGGGGGDPLITLNGTLVRFTSKASKPVVEIVGQIVPVQSGSGDPSPDNVRPITGWTGANVWQTGKNLFDKTVVTESKLLERTDGSLSNNNSYDTSDYIPVISGNQYTFTGFNYYYQRYYDADKNLLSTLPTNTATATIPSGVYYLRVSLLKTNLDAAQIELGSTASSYEPYTGNTIALSFGSTVYGGSYVINEDGTVTLTVDRESIDLGELTYTYKTESGIDYYFFQSSSISDFLIGYNDLICSQYKNAKNGNRKTMTSDHMIAITNSTNSNRVCIRDDSYSDADVFRTAMSGVQLVYELATPITTTLSSVTMLNTLVGENNMWTDTGDITVKAYGVEIVEPQLNSLQSLNLLLGNGYVNNHTADDVSDDEALDIILGGNER